MNSSQQNKSRAEWLGRNRAVWEGRRITEGLALYVFHVMQTAGLYSYTTNFRDIRSGLQNRIRSAKS